MLLKVDVSKGLCELTETVLLEVSSYKISLYKLILTNIYYTFCIKAIQY